MPSPSPAALSESYIKVLRGQGVYSAATLKRTATWLGVFVRFCGDRELAALTPEVLTAWRQELTWTPGPSGRIYAENTVNQAIGMVRRFLAWAVTAGHIQADPSTHLTTRRPPRKPKSLTLAERRRLLQAPDLDSPLGIRDRAVISLILETRISRAVCAQIQLHHLQLDTGTLLTQSRQRKLHSLADGTLADLERYLSFSRPLLVRSEQSALFLNKAGNPLSAGAVQGLLRAHAINAKAPLP